MNSKSASDLLEAMGISLRVNAKNESEMCVMSHVNEFPIRIGEAHRQVDGSYRMAESNLVLKDKNEKGEYVVDGKKYKVVDEIEFKKLEREAKLTSPRVVRRAESTTAGPVRPPPTARTDCPAGANTPLIIIRHSDAPCFPIDTPSSNKRQDVLIGKDLLSMFELLVLILQT